MVCSRKLRISSGKVTLKYGKGNEYRNNHDKFHPDKNDTINFEENIISNSVHSGATFSPFEDTGTCDLSSSKP